MGEVSDGYHTFNELYAHRVRLFSSLMHAYAELSWWSRKHSDGEEWDGWIIAGITTPEGEITYHLPVEEIEFLPEGTELEFGKEWDGHEANDVLGRLLSLRPAIAEPEPEPEEKQRKKPGRKPKAAADEPDNEG
ncbi:WDGH domain-containing protein [Escherichia coli]